MKQKCSNEKEKNLLVLSRQKFAQTFPRTFSTERLEKPLQNVTKEHTINCITKEQIINYNISYKL